jgi:hypothetical protein
MESAKVHPTQEVNLRQFTIDPMETARQAGYDTKPRRDSAVSVPTQETAAPPFSRGPPKSSTAGNLQNEAGETSWPAPEQAPNRPTDVGAPSSYAYIPTDRDNAMMAASAAGPTTAATTGPTGSAAYLPSAQNGEYRYFSSQDLPLCSPIDEQEVENALVVSLASHGSTNITPVSSGNRAAGM